MAALTTYATAVGLAATAATTTASFVQAAKFKKQQQKADREAEEALAAARKDISKNYFKGLSYAKEPYERAREAINIGLAQQTQAGVEGETRGAAAATGRSQMASIEAQRKLASAEAQDIYGLQKLAAEEEARLAGLSYNLNLAELFGQQAASQVAERNRQAQIQAGIEGVDKIINKAGEMISEYEATPEVRAVNELKGRLHTKYIKGQRQFNRAQKKGDISGDVTIGEFGNINPITTYAPGYDPALAQSYGDFYANDFASVTYGQNPLKFFEGMTPFEIKQYFANRGQ